MRLRIAAAAAAMLVIVACSNDGDSSAPDTVASTSSTSSSSTTTVKATTTTEAATTTTAPADLPVPLPPPAPRANEPRTELGTLEIPKLDLLKPLLEGVSLNTLDHGPGHWPGTAMPGHLGNVVIGGHRTSKDRPFRHIDQLVPGDEVILTTLEGRFVYKVVETQVVSPDSLWIIEQQRKYTATLFACHPAGSTKQRIIVFLELADPATAV